MNKLTNNQQTFLSLVRAGLWENEAFFLPIGEIDFGALFDLAVRQSVIGLIAAGVEHNSGIKIPQEILLKFASSAFQLERRNRSMNSFVGSLVEHLQNYNVRVLLVKGQGIAQCYEKPLWRACGDVDLFLNGDDYQKAIHILMPLSSSFEEESTYNKHQAMTIDGWQVELHGTLRSGLWRRIDRELDKVQEESFDEERTRIWRDGNTQVNLPGVNEDVVFVFSHILQHFFKEGIGLRQICDWCRLLWTYRAELDSRLLESRLQKMGVMTEWKAFGALAVDHLGMPIDAMPLYSPKSKWSRKANRILEFVLETGNFGHNRDYSYQRKYPYIVYKTISFWKHLKDGVFFFSIFPLDSIKVIWRRMVVGFSVVLKGKKHE